MEIDEVITQRVAKEAVAPTPVAGEGKITKVAINEKLISDDIYRAIDFDTEDGLRAYEKLNASQRIAYKSRLIDDYLTTQWRDVLERKISKYSDMLTNDAVRNLATEYFMQKVSTDFIHKALKHKIKVRIQRGGDNYYMSYRTRSRGEPEENTGIFLNSHNMRKAEQFRFVLHHEFHHFIDDA